jgi:hypothetical protein
MHPREQVCRYLTKEEHRQRHIELHLALDKVLAAYFGTDTLPPRWNRFPAGIASQWLHQANVLQLMMWSAETGDQERQTAFDELVADWLQHQHISMGKRFGNTSIRELMDWSR